MMFSRTFVFGDQVWPIVGQPVFALSSYDVAAFAFSPAWLRHAKPKGRSVVEPDGIEPTTSCLQSTRSPS